jgi:hypothetical protein
MNAQRALVAVALFTALTLGAHRCVAQSGSGGHCKDDPNEALYSQKVSCADLIRGNTGAFTGALLASKCEEEIPSRIPICVTPNTLFCVTPNTQIKEQCPVACNSCDQHCDAYDCPAGYMLKTNAASISAASDSTCCDGATRASVFAPLSLQSCPDHAEYLTCVSQQYHAEIYEDGKVNGKSRSRNRRLEEGPFLPSFPYNKMSHTCLSALPSLTPALLSILPFAPYFRRLIIADQYRQRHRRPRSGTV